MLVLCVLRTVCIMSNSAVNPVAISANTFKKYRLKPNPFESLRDPETGKWRVVFKLSGGKMAANSEQSKPLLAHTLPVQAVQEMRC